MPTSKPQARRAASAAKLRACPECGYTAIFVDFGPWVDFNGVAHYGQRQAAYCNNILCDQRFWWHPKSGRITRRNSGLTWKKLRSRRGLPDLVRLPDPTPVTDAPSHFTVFEEPHLPSVEEIFGRPPLHKRAWAWYKAHVWYHIERFGYRCMGLPV